MFHPKNLLIWYSTDSNKNEMFSLTLVHTWHTNWMCREKTPALIKSFKAKWKYSKSKKLHLFTPKRKNRSKDGREREKIKKCEVPFRSSAFVSKSNSRGSSSVWIGWVWRNPSHLTISNLKQFCQSQKRKLFEIGYYFLRRNCKQISQSSIQGSRKLDEAIFTSFRLHLFRYWCEFLCPELHGKKGNVNEIQYHCLMRLKKCAVKEH